MNFRMSDAAKLAWIIVGITLAVPSVIGALMFGLGTWVGLAAGFVILWFAVYLTVGR
jgi:hypothetical protein